MPLSEIHKKKLRKNLAIAALILLWCALIWGVTMIKVARAGDGDLRGPAHMYESRLEHQDHSARTQQQWLKDYSDGAEERYRLYEERETARQEQLDHIINTQQQWNQDWHDEGPARIEAAGQRDQQRREQLDETAARPRQWWDGWTRRQQEKNEQ